MDARGGQVVMRSGYGGAEVRERRNWVRVEGKFQVGLR